MPVHLFPETNNKVHIHKHKQNINTITTNKNTYINANTCSRKKKNLEEHSHSLFHDNGNEGGESRGGEGEGERVVRGGSAGVSEDLSHASRGHSHGAAEVERKNERVRERGEETTGVESL